LAAPLAAILPQLNLNLTLRAQDDQPCINSNVEDGRGMLYSARLKNADMLNK
jgi:hypothetical protein